MPELERKRGRDKVTRRGAAEALCVSSEESRACRAGKHVTEGSFSSWSNSKFRCDLVTFDFELVSGGVPGWPLSGAAPEPLDHKKSGRKSLAATSLATSYCGHPHPAERLSP